jgi:hypothetical protein
MERFRRRRRRFGTLTFDDRNGRDPTTSRRQHFRGWWRSFAGINHQSGIFHAQMGLVLPIGIALDLCEWLSSERLYPPAAFTPGIQHDLLSWANASRPPLDNIHLIWTAYIRHGDFGEFDRRAKSAALTRIQKEEAEEEKDNLWSRPI